jgi:acyl transferase domain-containing protein
METSQPIKKAPYTQDPIAVVGIACHLPGNSNFPRAPWKALGTRKDCRERFSRVAFQSQEPL